MPSSDFEWISAREVSVKVAESRECHLPEIANMRSFKKVSLSFDNFELRPLVKECETTHKKRQSFPV